MNRFFGLRTKVFTGFLALATFSMPVAAVPISFSFEGVVTTVGSNVSSTFSVNDLVSGGFTFDSDAANVGDSTFGRYAYTSFHWNIGTYTGSSTLVGANDVMGVYNDVALGDVFLVRSDNPNGANVGGLAPEFLLWRLIDTSATVFDDVAVPLSPPPLSAFDTADTSLSFMVLDFVGGAGIDYQVRARITSLTATKIPEPSILLLFGAGLLGLGVIRRKKA